MLNRQHYRHSVISYRVAESVLVINVWLWPSPRKAARVYHVGRGGRVGKSAGLVNPEVLGSNPTDAVSNLGQVRLPHVALVSQGRF